ncbi:MAG: hypothetical protein WCA11_06510 [Terracidiphilus sp.]
MNRSIFIVAFFAAATAALGAQQASQSNPYEGTSTPPPDDTIITSTTPQPKPPAAHPEIAPQAAPAQSPSQQTPAMRPSDANLAPVGNTKYAAMSGDGTDDGIVQVAPPLQNVATSQRLYTPDPDGDIVHPAPLGPGELGEGTSIRVELIGDLSSARSENGQPFRSRVASDVVEGGQVLIPAGSEIDGTVVGVSTGHFGGHGSLMLRPEKVILPNGSSYRLHAVVTDAPDSNTRVGAEGVIGPGSRLKRDGIEYGGVVGGGAITGAFLGGPAGALAGGIIGAGVVTTHLLVSHPQANLDSGTTLMLTLTERMHLVSEGTNGN